MQAIPIGAAYQDLIALAPTGSGKSAAFLLPMLNYLSTLPPLDYMTALEGPYALILAPTRELAIQIHQEAERLKRFTKVRTFCLVGGHDIESQSYELQKGVELVIGTPGRVLDCLLRSYLVLSQCCWVVVDEADKIFLLKQEETLLEIIGNIQDNLKSEEPEINHTERLSMSSGLARYRITHLYSATMSPEIERVWRLYLRCPVQIQIGRPGSNQSQITQRVYFVTASEKRKTLLMLLKQTRAPIIVFVNYKNTIEQLCQYLEQFDWRVGTLHGDKSQMARERIFDLFKGHRLDVLIATDVASRGLDIDKVRHVINYDCPHTITDYEHRIGRTGRMGQGGLASTLLTPGDEDILLELKLFLERNGQEVPEELSRHPKVTETF